MQLHICASPSGPTSDAMNKTYLPPKIQGFRDFPASLMYICERASLYTKVVVRNWFRQNTYYHTIAFRQKWKYWSIADKLVAKNCWSFVVWMKSWRCIAFPLGAGDGKSGISVSEEACSSIMRGKVSETPRRVLIDWAEKRGRQEMR